MKHLKQRLMVASFLTPFLISSVGCDSAGGDRPTEIETTVDRKPSPETSSSTSADLQFAEVDLPTGITMHYASQGTNQKGVLLLLHGLVDSWFSFSGVLPSIPLEYKVYAVDQRGHGNTSKPETDYRLENYVSDALAFMDRMEISEVILVGHSMGSFISQRIAIDHPERVKGLVLIGSAPRTENNPLVAQLKLTFEELEDPIDLEFIREVQAPYRPLPEAFFDRVVEESAKAPVRVWRQALDGLEVDHRAELPSITAPTLILAGDKDVFFTPEEQHELAKLIPNSSLEIYEETGHGVQWERPDKASEHLLAFLETIAP